MAVESTGGRASWGGHTVCPRTCRQRGSLTWRTPRAPRVREPFYGVIDPVERTVYVNDPSNVAGTAALLDAIIAGRL